MNSALILLNLILGLDKTPPEMIKGHGYPSETHSLYTDDGYNLILHRIPHGKKCKKENSTPILVQHGFIEGSQLWLFLGPENALGFLLADNCYDVWLGNARGNCHSRGHKSLTTHQTKFWDYSYHEIGLYDLKAEVDYILNVTKKDEILYVGYSEGTTSALVNAIYHPDNKIKAYFLLAPIAFFTNNLSFYRKIAPLEPILTQLTQKVIGNFELRFNFGRLRQIEKMICSLFLPELCYIPSLMCGSDPINVNRTVLPYQLADSCGISTKQLLHYVQGFYLEFRHYNYGAHINQEKYGNSTPPPYDFKKINKPVYLYHSKMDFCADVKDVKKLVKKLGDNLVKIHLVDNPVFDHLGFVFNNNAKEQVYDVLISDLHNVLS